MNEEFQEYYFLTDGYEKGITDKKVYSLFLTKVFAGMVCPITYSINKLQQDVERDYKIEIPPTFIKDIIRELPGFGEDFVLKKDIINIKKIPEIIESQVKEKQKESDEDTRLIFDTFNEYLEFNNCNKIQYKEFATTFKTFCNILVKEETQKTEMSRIMADWIYGIYKSKKNQNIIIVLNKMVYSWLLYNYYYSVKRQKKKLQDFSIIFDTNILVYLLGINGKERQLYVEYLIKKMKDNNCRIIIHDYTIKELNDLLDSEMNVCLKIFNNENYDKRNQIKYNSDMFFKEIFKQEYGINLIDIDCYQQKIDKNSKEYKEIASSLHHYKSFKRPSLTDQSIYHDIMLVYSTGNLKKISNIYQEKKFIATCDNVLCSWFDTYIKEKYNGDYTNLLSLEKLNLIFWIESDKAQTSDFLANTWLYVSDTLGYFNDYAVDEYFKKIREKSSVNVLDNWRSVYLLVKNQVGQNKENQEDDFENIIDSINGSILSENQELLSENQKLLSENQELKLELIKSKEEKNKNEEIIPNVIVNNIMPEQKIREEDISICKLFILILKKIINFFTRKS